MGRVSGAALATDFDAAFEDLVFYFQDGLYSFAVGLCGDFALAEDIVQEAFVRAYRALKSYDTERLMSLALRPWLYRVTLNSFRNTVRRRRVDAAELSASLEQADEAPGPEHLAIRSAEWEQLLARLAQLPDSQRAALLLRYVRDLPYAAISELLDEPVNTVKSHVHRGLNALRRSYLQEVS